MPAAFPLPAPLPLVTEAATRFVRHGSGARELCGWRRSIDQRLLSAPREERGRDDVPADDGVLNQMLEPARAFFAIGRLVRFENRMDPHAHRELVDERERAPKGRL